MKKIFVLEDDEAILTAFELTFETAGYSVYKSNREDDIYKTIKNIKPDLIVLDVLLSGQDGREICKHLKSLENTKNIPIIMTSAHPDAHKTSLAAGADDFIAKPFDINVLLDKVENLIK